MVARVSFAQLRRGVRLLLSGIEEEGGLVAAAPVVQVREIFRRFWPDARPYKRFFLLTLVFVALGPALQAVEIYLYKILVDDVLVPRDFDPFIWLAAAYIGLNVLGGVIGFFDEYMSTWVLGPKSTPGWLVSCRRTTPLTSRCC